MKQHLLLASEITLFHDLSLESKKAKNILDTFSIPYTGIFSESDANWYLPFIFVGKNSYRIRGIEEISAFLVDEIKNNKSIFYSQIKYDTKYGVDGNNFWVLESLFGEEEVIQILLASEKKLTDSVIENLIENSELKFYTSTNNTILTSSDSELMKIYFEPLTEISHKNCLELFNIKQLEEAKEKGYIKL